MAPTRNEQQGSANPYRSPHAPVDDSPPRSSRFRILPTALLWIFALLSLLSHVYIMGMVIVICVQEGWLKSDPDQFEYILGVIRPELRIPASAIGIGADVVGIMAARHCWQGRWLRSAVEAGIFITGTLLANFLIFVE